MNKTIISPRLRVNKSTNLNLSTTWQDIVFDGTSPINTNTFGKDPVSGNNMVHYDSANNLFRFYEQYDINYQVTLYLKMTTTVVSTGMSVQYRLVVPNGGGAGVNTYFPFPDTDGYADVGYVALKLGSVLHPTVPIAMYLSQGVKTNGIKLQLRLSEAIVGMGTITLNHAIALIQQ